MFKRILTALLAAIFCLSLLAGCAGNETTGKQTTAPTEGEKGSATAARTTGSAETTGKTAEQTAETEPAPTVEPTAEPTVEPTVEPTPTPTPTAEPTPTPTPTPEPEGPLPYGVYQLISSEGQIFCSTKTNDFIADYTGGEKYDRFTIHAKYNERENYTYYGIYKGYDEVDSLGVMLRDNQSKFANTKEHYTLSDNSLWDIQPVGNGFYRIYSKSSIVRKKPECLTLKNGKGVLIAADDSDPGQIFRIVRAPESTQLSDYYSDKGNVVIRIPKEYLSKRTTGATDEIMQNYANWMQEAYEAEVELTGYAPYDVIVFDMWQKQNIVAGVVNNYNVVKADKGFMQNEIKLMVQRARILNIKDLNFAMLHEMGHMFDSNRAWCFESEAWTDLKLCYVVHKLTETHKNTDGLIFGCSSSDYSSPQVCHTYETLAEGLDIHGKKGAMTKEYGFFGAARLFLLMAYDFGWEPFIKTFHYYQDNGMTQATFTKDGVFNNWNSFLSFVDKLSEYSGKDIKNDYLSEENWECFRKFYMHETSVAL